jgi:hypothetical protein
LQNLRASRTVAFLLAGLLAGWATCAAALDRVRAIETAKTALGEKCAAEGACTFDATRVEGKWRVRVDFVQGRPPKAKPPAKAAPAIFLINDAGRIVGRIGSQAP